MGRFFVSIVFAVSLFIGGDFAQAGGNEKADPQVLKPLDKENPYQSLKSGKSFLPGEISAIQDDSFGNPGTLVLLEGEKFWSKKSGSSEKSCAFCHNDASTAMAGVGARYPAYNKDKRSPITLEQRINLCRKKHMKAQEFSEGSEAMIALSAYVKSFSNGRAVSVKVEGKLAGNFAAGRKDYYRRRGQLNMSCAQCHEENVGKKYRGLTLSQGHGNGYPAFHVPSQKVISLHQRFQQCNRLVRTEPYDLGSEDYVNLELYLAWRGKGLGVETPAVRY